MNNVEYSFLITLLAGLSTIVGSFLIFLKFKDISKVICCSLAFAAGVMITISMTDLIPSAINGILQKYYLVPGILITLIFIIIGIVISNLINKYIPDVNVDKIGDSGLYKVGLISMIAIILHNVPEGIATFMTSTKNLELGLSLALAITLHNIPEGISISVPIYYSTKSKFKALVYTFISGISESFGAVIAYVFLAPFMSDLIMSFLLAIIAGIMISISTNELIPASLKYNHKKKSIVFYLIGSIFMIMCHLCL